MMRRASESPIPHPRSFVREARFEDALAHGRAARRGRRRPRECERHPPVRGAAVTTMSTAASTERVDRVLHRAPRAPIPATRASPRMHERLVSGCSLRYAHGVCERRRACARNTPPTVRRARAIDRITCAAAGRCARSECDTRRVARGPATSARRALAWSDPSASSRSSSTQPAMAMTTACRVDAPTRAPCRPTPSRARRARARRARTHRRRAAEPSAPAWRIGMMRKSAYDAACRR